jgi:glutamate synthases, NADH/NADPH, small subunit
MGKSTGFMEYQRIAMLAKPPEIRIENFSEFHIQPSCDDTVLQAARCMDCGVPFCQSGMVLDGMKTGCPLNNLIPEWNDEIYKGHWLDAYHRLSMANNFPEFTGRVCPALCEAACTCGMNDSAVTIRENELSIIENAFEKGYVKIRSPKKRSDKKAAVIGSGPAGLAVADCLNMYGHNVTVYERDDRPGGLLMYGIPNMKLDKKVISRRIKHMESEGIKFITDADVGKNISPDEIMINHDVVVMCCGARNARKIQSIPDNIKGVYSAVDYLTSATRAHIGNVINYITARDKNVVVIGGGDTGNDCVATAVRQKCKSVVQFEIMPKSSITRPAGNEWPRYPKVLKTDYGQEEAIYKFGTDPRLYQTTIDKVFTDSNNRITRIKTNNGECFDTDMILIAAGFIGCEEYVSDMFDLNKANIFTCGDMRTGQSLVVSAIADGRKCAAEVNIYLNSGHKK